jgi:hypothetical protein
MAERAPLPVPIPVAIGPDTLRKPLSLIDPFGVLGFAGRPRMADTLLAGRRLMMSANLSVRQMGAKWMAFANRSGQPDSSGDPNIRAVYNRLFHEAVLGLEAQGWTRARAAHALVLIIQTGTAAPGTIIKPPAAQPGPVAAPTPTFRPQPNNPAEQFSIGRQPFQPLPDQISLRRQPFEEPTEPVEVDRLNELERQFDARVAERQIVETAREPQQPVEHPQWVREYVQWRHDDPPEPGDPYYEPIPGVTASVPGLPESYTCPNCGGERHTDQDRAAGGGEVHSAPAAHTHVAGLPDT